LLLPVITLSKCIWKRAM